MTENRRKDERLKLKGEITIQSIVPGVFPSKVAIYITNCSKHGLGFRCLEELQMDSNYETDLTIWTGEVLHAILKIVRVQEQNFGYEYGAIFIGMPDADAQRIAVYETVKKMTDE